MLDTMLTTARRIPVPPWTVIVPQLMWLLSAFLSICIGCLANSTFNFSIAGFCIFLIFGLHLRWRAAFWLSVLCFAAVTGGDLARILASASLPASVVIGALISLGMLILHQVPTSLRWFGFEKQRSVRFLFWCLSALVCVVSELWLIHFLPKPD